MVTQPPQISLVTREARAVDARLLAGAEADEGAVQGVGDAVGLGVFEREGGDDEISYR